MSKCSFCGEKAGLFSSEHRGCRVRAEESTRRGSEKIEQAISQGFSSSDVINALIKNRSEGKFYDQEEPTRAWLRSADKAAMERSRCEPIGPEEFSDIGNIFVYLKKDFYQQGEGLLNYPGYCSLDHSNVLHQVLHGQTPYMPTNAHSGFQLGSGENLILKRNAQLAEYTQVTPGYSYQSVSLPIGGGIYYRLGLSTPRVSQTSLQVVDQGKLALSDRAIYFGGNRYTFRIAYEDILRLEPYKDAFEIHENYGSGKIFVPGTLGFDDGWYFFALISAFIDRARV